MKKLVFIKTILFFVVLQPVFAEKISIIRDPIYSYKLSTGPVEAVYSTPEEAIQGLQAYYNEHQNPHPAQPHRRLYAPYPSVDSSITNGRPNTWIWDYDVYYPASPELDYSGSTGVVNMGVNCPSAPAFENSAWVMRGERVTSQNVKIWCEVDSDRPEQPPSMCERDSGKFGNPVNIYSRAKQHEEPIYQDFSPGGLYFSWHYESRPANKIIDHTHAGVHGYWRHSFEYELRRVMEDVYVLTSPNAPKAIFWKNKLMGFDSGWLSSSSYMEPVGGGQISAVRNTSTGTTYYFNHHGKVLQISSPDNRPGIQFSLEYDSSNRLVEVRDRFGKVIQFGGYLGEKLGKIITPDGNVFSFLHQENNLYRVDFGNGEYTTYLYEEQDRRNLTGYAVAGGEKLAHYVYDSQGRAISTELVGGINKFHFKYYSWDPYFTEMTTPLGSVVRINFSAMSGNLLVTNISSPPPGAASAIASASFNASGLKAWEDDFLGNRKSFEWNTIRRFPEKITLAANSPDAKATEIEWHTAFDLPSRIAEPSREARREYDAGGNLLRETLATAGGAWSRHWTYAQDLATSHTDEAGNTYIYGYDSRGNLTTVTDPAGLSTQYTHDGAGRVITVTEPSGSIRQYTYDHRGRTTSASVNGLLTSYTYSLQGLLEKTVYPNGYVVFHDYDPVRRPIGWHDNRGARKILTLDNAGNAVDEAWETASAVPVYKIQRVFNSSGQLTQVIRGNSTSISYALDGNGDLSGVVLGSGGRTDYSRDGLRRVYRLRDQNGHSATIDYDPFGAVAKATDFAKVATSYTRDALGNALQEVSPDAGNITATHDERGLLASITEASGRTTTYTRDALGRPTLLQYADGTRTLLRYDLPGSPYNAPGAPNASVGHLSEIQHPGATTQYQRDLLGRITRKTQALASGDMKTASYTYVPAGQGGAGQLASITYPSGRQLAYQYDATGQLTSLQWSGQPLLANLTWNPLGQPTGWRWPGIAGGLTEVRQYDTAGQLTRTSLLDLAWDGAGRITAIQQSQMVPSSAGQAPQTARIGSAYSYDLIGRLTASAHALQGTPALAWPTGLALADVTGYASMGYGYDANGNRLSDVRVRPLASGNSLTTIRTHAIAAGTNRLSGITTVGDSSAAIGYGYDATGAITSATRQGTTYHLHYGADGRIARLTASGNAADLQAVSYHYNGLGQRIAKTDTRASTSAPHIEHTLYSDEDGTQPLGTYGNQRSAGSAAPAGESDSTEVIYLPTAAGLMPIAAHINGRLYAIHTDHLNTPRRLTNAQGQVAWQWLVTGFGEVNPTTGAGGYLQQGNGYTYSEPVTFNLRYPGQQWDEETGLAYNLHRYYDAQNGRYIQADPIGLEGGWNRFAYVEGNPLSLIDPEGLQFLDLTTLAGLRRETTLDDAVRAGGWTRAITMPVVTAGLTPSAIGLVGYSSAPLLCSTTTTVTSWAPAGVVPDLAAGRWVMQGGPNVWNYIRTGVWGPRFTQGQGFSWQPYPISNSVTGTATVGWPSGIANFWRGIFGQRQVTP